MEYIFDNFSFLKPINIKLYAELHKCESNSRIDPANSAHCSRKAFEILIDKMICDNEISICEEDKSLQRQIEKLSKANALIDLGVIEYETLQANNRNKCDAYQYLRMLGNRGSHSDKRVWYKPKFSFNNLVLALELLHRLAQHVYRDQLVGIYINRYDRSKMPIGRYFIYSVKRLPEWDKSGCLFEYKGVLADEDLGIRRFAIIRQYSTKMDKTLVLRNSKCFYEASKSGETIIPEGMAQFEEINEYSEGVAYYLIAYTFPSEPYELTDDILKTLNYSERISVCSSIINAFSKLHGFKEPIYHRLLNPSCIYVCKTNLGKYMPYIINFSFAKIEGSNKTVKVSAYSARNELIRMKKYDKYIAPETAFQFEHNSKQIEWDKVDVFSLGMLMADILKGEFSSTVLSFEDLLNIGVSEELSKTIALMCADDPCDRPELTDVQAIINSDDMNGGIHLI